MTIAAAIVLVAARRSPAPDIRLLFAGDILLARQVNAERQHTGQSPWDSIAPLFAQADWVGGNFEGAIGDSSECVSSNRELCFAVGTDAPNILAKAGLSVVSLENNHINDLGPRAKESTKRSLAQAGLPGVDFQQSPAFMRVGDLTVAMIAITMIPGADGRAQAVPSVNVAQRLRLARELANVVIVSVHWGTELQNWTNPSQRATAEWLVDHGADVVMGHHPHVVQKPDCVHGHPVFYSLGNHVFDQKYPETKEGLIADCIVHAGRLRCGGVNTHARHGSAMPVVSGRLNPTELAACTLAVHPSITVAGWTIRPAPWSVSTADSTGVVLEGWRAGAVRWRTRRTDIVSLEPQLGVDDGGPPLLLALERHPSTMDGEIGIRPHVYEATDRGLIARWRGTALAWPLIDAVVDGDGDLCALHRGDSFVRLDPTNQSTRTMRYRWNGFGFAAARDPGGECARAFTVPAAIGK